MNIKSILNDIRIGICINLFRLIVFIAPMDCPEGKHIVETIKNWVKETGVTCKME